MGVLGNRYFVYVIFLVSMIYSLSGIFYGLDFSDTFFHLNYALRPTNGVYLYPTLLTSLLIKFIVGILGTKLIYLRLANLFFFIAPVFITFYGVIKLKNHSTINALFYTSLVVFLVGPINNNVLGYNSFTILFVVITFFTLIRYLKRPNYYLFTVLIILSAVSALIRLPNLLMVIVIFLAMLFRPRKKILDSSIGDALLFVLLTILIIGLSFYSYYQSFHLFNNAGIDGSRHSPIALLLNYFNDGIQLIFYSFFLLCLFFLYKALSKLNKNRYLIAIVFVIYISFLFVFILFTSNSWNYRLFLTSLSLSIMAVQAYKLFRQKNYNQIFILLIIVAFIFIPPFGSNSGLLKSSNVFILFPFIYVFTDFEYKKYWLYLSILLTPFAIVENMSLIYQDKKITELNYTLKDVRLYPIKTSHSRGLFIDKVDRCVKELQKENFQVYFYGSKSHIFHYLYPNTDLNLSSFIQPVNGLQFIEDIKEKVFKNEKVAIFIIDDYPNKKANEVYKLSVFEKELIKQGFKQGTKNLDFVYLKK